VQNGGQQNNPSLRVNAMKISESDREAASTKKRSGKTGYGARRGWYAVHVGDSHARDDWELI
jgi:hypothetical protein